MVFRLRLYTREHSSWRPLPLFEAMKAIGVENYGPPGNLHSREVPKPGSPQGRDLLIK
jgi:hypothetical protein